MSHQHGSKCYKHQYSLVKTCVEDVKSEMCQSCTIKKLWRPKSLNWS